MLVVFQQRGFFMTYSKMILLAGAILSIATHIQAEPKVQVEIRRADLLIKDFENRTLNTEEKFMDLLVIKGLMAHYPSSRFSFLVKSTLSEVMGQFSELSVPESFRVSLVPAYKDGQETKYRIHFEVCQQQTYLQDTAGRVTNPRHADRYGRAYEAYYFNSQELLSSVGEERERMTDSIQSEVKRLSDSCKVLYSAEKRAQPLLP